MKNFLTICLLLVSCQVASAQHGLYKWQLSGYTGIANYANDENSSPDYFKINNNLLHRLELTRSIGNTFGLSLGYSMGEVRGNNQQLNPFTTDVRMAALRAYFYTDNGWMFNTSALVSPYFFGGYGLSTLETTSGTMTAESRHVSVVPFGMGLKFRVSERWQLALQTEAVYLAESHLQGAALEQNDFNNAYLHTGIRIGYSFGFRKSTFKAPRFYSGDVALLQTVQGLNQPRQNELEMMLKIAPKRVQVITAPDAANVEQPTIIRRVIVSPADTITTTGTMLDADTSSSLAQIRRHRLVPAEPTQITDTTTTSEMQTISSARTIIRLDSVVGDNTIQPAPVAPERSEAVEEPVVVQSQPAVVTEQRVQTQDSVITTTTITTIERAPVTTQEAAPVRTERRAPATGEQADPVISREEAPARTEQSSTIRTQEAAPVRADQRAPVRTQEAAPVRADQRAPVRTQEAAPVRADQRAPVRTQEAAPVRADQRAPVRTQEAAPVRAKETARVIERNVYVPSATRSATVQNAEAAQLREERIRLTTVNAENRRLQGRIDSMQAVPQTTGDSLVTVPAAAIDTSMVQYLQQQAALNDSMLQRLNQYEKELALLKNASAAPAPAPAPVIAPAEVAPEVALVDYTTTVFYPINAHSVPPASLRDLNQALKTLQENPDTEVKLTGYTSRSGNAAYNLALSRKRVQGLVDFLTDQGIAEDRIRTEYRGDEESSQKENPLDRKVEVQIIE
ncbi:OmpA family protein [Pontibacter pamirensis]|uniref:OmpA family protein n=1 Tax=Pontibacter pamirensis TaxID=2562824 RepID=UPI00138A3AC6|nr:OmpA family protein [Pontibacter pamirensis]